jgi:hypothetical protein
MNYSSTAPKPSVPQRSEGPFDRLMRGLPPEAGDDHCEPPPLGARHKRKGPRGPQPPPPNGYCDRALMLSIDHLTQFIAALEPSSAGTLSAHSRGEPDDGQQ